jgi:fructose-1,6-bisphosphatase/inositol monophosphatase family enzyme
MIPDERDFPLGPWPDRLERLAGVLREAARGAMRRAIDGGRLDEVDRPVGQGAGDLTYGLDLVTENALDRWFDKTARESPLSLFSEDAGWRHRGPSAGGKSRSLPGFDHGGPRVVIDPVDGTRNMMADLRSAWTVIALCGPGEDVPRMSEATFGLVAELPDSRAERYRILTAERGCGAHLQERFIADGSLYREHVCQVDGDDRVDHGYFSFFRYTPAMRPLLARIEAEFFERLARSEGADLRNCFDDQYISNGGQLVLLILGTYRMIADLRARLAPNFDVPCTTSKPYDCAGAIVIAREAGCILTDAEGAALDFPLDATTPVHFVGYANRATASRLAPHLAAVMP